MPERSGWPAVTCSRCLANGAHLINLPGGLVDMQGSSNIRHSPARVWVINNQGTLANRGEPARAG